MKIQQSRSGSFAIHADQKNQMIQNHEIWKLYLEHIGNGEASQHMLRKTNQSTKFEKWLLKNLRSWMLFETTMAAVIETFRSTRAFVRKENNRGPVKNNYTYFEFITLKIADVSQQR